MKNIFKLVGIIAMIAVIGFSFAACGDGAGGGGGGTTIDEKWIGTYKGDFNPPNTVTVTADTVTTRDGETYTVRSDEGVSDDGAQKYNLNPPEGSTLLSIYFYDADPDYLTLGTNSQYKKQ